MKKGLSPSLDETERASSVFILAPQCSQAPSSSGSSGLADQMPAVAASSPLTPTPPFQRRNLILGTIE